MAVLREVRHVPRIRLRDACCKGFDARDFLIDAVCESLATNYNLWREGGVVVDAAELRFRCVAVVGIDAPLAHVGEVGCDAVEVLCRKGIVLVVVALCTGDGRAKESAPDRADAVRCVLCQVFTGLCATLTRDHIEAVKAGCGAGCIRCVWNQVPGQLVAHKGGVRHIDFEGIDDPVAVGPGIMVLVAVEANRISVADLVEPPDGHPLGMGIRCQQAVNIGGVDLLRWVCCVSLDVIRGWRKPS